MPNAATSPRPALSLDAYAVLLALTLALLVRLNLLPQVKW
jgi:hypothetical protein